MHRLVSDTPRMHPQGSPMSHQRVLPEYRRDVLEQFEALPPKQIRDMFQGMFG